MDNKGGQQERTTREKNMGEKHGRTTREDNRTTREDNKEGQQRRTTTKDNKGGQCTTLQWDDTVSTIAIGNLAQYHTYVRM